VTFGGDSFERKNPDPMPLVTCGYNHGPPVRAVDADGFLDSLVDLRVQDF
jgi:hypothetical protein